MYLVYPLHIGNLSMGTFTNSEDPDVCHKVRHFIWVYTVCQGKKDLRAKKSIYFLNYNLTPLDMYNGISRVRATARHCCQMRRNYKFGAKILCNNNTTSILCPLSQFRIPCTFLHLLYRVIPHCKWRLTGGIFLIGIS